MNKPSDDGIHLFMNYSSLQFLGYIQKKLLASGLVQTKRGTMGDEDISKIT